MLGVVGVTRKAIALGAKNEDLANGAAGCGGASRRGPSRLRSFADSLRKTIDYLRTNDGSETAIDPSYAHPRESFRDFGSDLQRMDSSVWRRR